MKEKQRTRAVPYLRVSSPKQVTEGHGLESQESRCREYAAHRGYEIVAVFRDEGVSGGLIDRPGMQEMLAFLEDAGEGELVVLIDDISRLARDLEAHLRLRAAISKAGGRLESPSIAFGTDSDSILVENLLASVSQHQRQKNAEQVKNRMRARLLAGYWVFYAPVGYRYQEVDGHGRMLVRDEPHASVVAELYGGVASGRFESAAEVQRYLETIPEFALHRDGAVNHQSVLNLLNRPLYAGYLDFPAWGINLLPGKHEPLITFETWQKAQQRLKGESTASARRDMSADFPLRGFVTCSACGRAMSAGWSKGRGTHYAYYFCQNGGCSEHRRSVRKHEIEGEFEALLRSMMPTPHLFFMVREMLEDVWDGRQAHMRERTAEVRAEIMRIERKSEQLMERLVSTDSPTLIAAYENQVRKLEEAKVALRERMAAGGSKRAEFEETFRTALSFLGNPWNLWDSGRLEDKRIALRLAFDGKLPYRRNEGFTTVNPALPFKVLAGIEMTNTRMVGRAGIEPATSRV